VMQHLIATYGLLAVLVLMAAESACIPVPSEVTMLFAGALAAGAVSGPHPSLAAVIVAGTLGNVVGSYLAWLMGKYGGRPGLRRWGRYLGLRPQEIDKAQDWFDRCGASVVFWSRLLPGIRTFISLPAGIAEMPAARFGLYTAAGCLPWTAVLAIVGYGIGADWQTIERAMHRHNLAIAVVVFMAIGIWVLSAIRRNRRESPGEAVSSVNPPTIINARDQGASRWREIVCSRRGGQCRRLDDDDALRSARTGPRRRPRSSGQPKSTNAKGNVARVISPLATSARADSRRPRWCRDRRPEADTRHPGHRVLRGHHCYGHGAAMPTEKLPLVQRHATPARPLAQPATTASCTINTSDEAK
jgi:membrane protein DedA with SNARE-associated domain